MLKALPARAVQCFDLISVNSRGRISHTTWTHAGRSCGGEGLSPPPEVAPRPLHARVRFFFVRFVQTPPCCVRRFVVFEAKVLKEHVGAATKLLGELVSGKPGDVAAAKAAMLATLDAAKASPEEV